MVSRDPLDPDNFGKQNVGIYRMEVKGKRKLGLQPVPMHDIALHLHKAEERGEDLPIAITLGNDPIITLMGATPLKYDQSEYEMAGALRESPYPIATAPLTGFDVPWGSEVILEGSSKAVNVKLKDRSANLPATIPAVATWPWCVSIRSLTAANPFLNRSIWVCRGRKSTT